MSEKRTPPGKEFEPSDEQRELVAILASCGIPQPVIASFVKWPEGIGAEANQPISDRTLRKVFREELDAGTAMAHAKLIKTAFSMAMKGNTAMVIFLLKTRLGWKEPAQDVNIHATYGELVTKAAEIGKPDLKVIQGGKPADA